MWDVATIFIVTCLSTHSPNDEIKFVASVESTGNDRGLYYLFLLLYKENFLFPRQALSSFLKLKLIFHG